MPDLHGADTGASTGPSNPFAAQNLDSKEAADNFLAAINFGEGPSKKGENAAPSPQQTPSAPCTRSPGNNVKIPSMPPSRPPNFPGRGRGGDGPLARLPPPNNNSLVPPGLNYWEAERIRKGIVEPPPHLRAWAESLRKGTDNANKATISAANNAASPAQSAGTRNSGRNSGVKPGHWKSNTQGPHGGKAPPRPGRPSLGYNSPTAGPETPFGGHGRRPNRISQLPPEIRKAPMPRPNPSYAGSSYSLPSLGSGLRSNTGSPAQGTKDANQATRDIRNKIAINHNLRYIEGAWHRYNWSSWDGKDNDDELKTPRYLGAFIEAWSKKTPKNVRTRFDKKEHWKCDIDTSTGQFLQPVAYPDTVADTSYNDPGAEVRRHTLSSHILMMKFNADPRNRRRAENYCADYAALTPTPRYPISKDQRMVMRDDPATKAPEYHPFVPRIRCFLRPAEKFDMEAVRLIYNWEVENGLQALDSQPLQVEDFENILATTEGLGMPFLVAVRGSAKALDLKEGNLDYSPFNQYPVQEEDKRGEILGFAYLSVWQSGLAGSKAGSSRATARINVFVHPDHRRKKIGFSLIDKLLLTASECFSSENGYDFIDPDSNPMYISKTRKRQHYKVYLSYFVRHKLRTGSNRQLEEEQKTYDDDLVWVREVVEEKLNFTEKLRFEGVHRSPQGREGAVQWLDEVVFEHVCLYDALRVEERA